MGMVGIDWYIDQLAKLGEIVLFLLGLFAVISAIVCVISVVGHLLFDREYRAGAKRCMRIAKRYFRKNLLAFRAFFF